MAKNIVVYFHGEDHFAQVLALFDHVAGGGFALEGNISHLNSWNSVQDQLNAPDAVAFFYPE